VAVTNPKIEKTEYFEKVLRNLEAYVRPPAGKSKMGRSPPSLPPSLSSSFLLLPPVLKNNEIMRPHIISRISGGQTIN